MELSEAHQEAFCSRIYLIDTLRIMRNDHVVGEE